MKDPNADPCRAIDAGWEEPGPVVSEACESTALQPEAFDPEALDAGWELGDAVVAATPDEASVRPASRPHQRELPVDPTRVPRQIPRAVSKKELREAQRRQIAHAAKRKAEHKEQRRVQRRAEAERVAARARHDSRSPQSSQAQVQGQGHPSSELVSRTLSLPHGRRLDRSSVRNGGTPPRDGAVQATRPAKASIHDVATKAVHMKAAEKSVSTPRHDPRVTRAKWAAFMPRVFIGILVALAVGGVVLVILGRLAG